MPVYKDNAQNRKLNRVGKTWGKDTPKKSAPKKAEGGTKEITKETSMAISQKLNSIKKADLDKLLNFNQSELEKYSNKFYGSNNWITLMGKVGEVKKRFMTVINERYGTNIDGKHSEQSAQKILTLLGNYKTSF
tara:strand:+ start:344 stop:745 length:402 start_codon:yes stop_codon:yes gene_type:complete